MATSGIHYRSALPCCVVPMLFSDRRESTACHRRPLGGILSVCEAPEWPHGLENVYIHKVVSSNWVEFLYSVNYPFYALTRRE